MKIRRGIFGAILAVLAIGILVPVALATAAPPHARRIGSAPRVPPGAKVIGPVSRAARIPVTVTLRSQAPGALAAYATAVSTPGSSLYHHYLNVAQFAARFGATTSQVRAVVAILRADGLRVGQVTPNRLSVPVSGTAAQLTKAFSTGLQNLRLHNGRRAFRNTRAPRVPARIAGVVQGVIGLDNLTLAQPEGLTKPVRIQTRPNSGATTSPNIGSGPQPCSAIAGYDTTSPGPYTADRMASAYGFGSLYPGDEGAGQTIALYELEPFSSSDVSSYETCYGGISPTITTTVCSACTSPGTGAGSGESILDIEDVIGFAPKANVIVYEGKNGTDNYNVYSAIITANVAKVISTSWGLCESSAGSSYASSENTLFEEAATQGQSVFAAAGDHGSEDCGGTGSLAVDDPASQPYVTGVGGTRMSSAAYPPTESVWNDYNGTNSGQNEDTGGGISSFWQMPSYQTGAKASLGVINSSSSGTPCGASSGSYCREVPDVTADAAPSTGYLIYFSGPGGTGWYESGGTSAAAPLWAAYTALVNASSGCTSTPVGFANPDLYAVAGNAWSGSAYTADYNDITSGNNNPLNYSTSGLPYSAGVGFDMTSGLGSMNGASLTTALCAPKAIGTVALPSGGSFPTGVVVDTTNHDAYVAVSGANKVAEITNTGNSYFSTTATNVSSAPLPSLNFPDDLALDASHNVYASNFCVGSQASVCASEPSGTTAALSQQTGSSSGQADVFTCHYPAGDAVYTPTTGAARLFVACAGSGFVAECTPTSGNTPLCGTADQTVTLTTPGGGATPVPSGVAAIPTAVTSTPSVVVADAANSTLSVVSYSGSSLVTSSPTSLASGCKPAYVAVGPASSGSAAVYVACPGTGTVEVGTVSGSGLSSFTATTLPTTGTSTPRPYGVAVNATGTDLVVTDAANNDAVIYPSLSGTTLGTGTVVSVGSTPDGVAMDGGNAFIANEGSNNVSVVDPPAHTAPQSYAVSGQAAAARATAQRPVTLMPLVAPVR